MKKVNLWILLILFLLFSFLYTFFSSINSVNNIAIELTPEEKSWLKEHPVVTIGFDPAYAPFEFYEDGEYQGMSVDYIKWIESQLNIDIQFVEFDSWSSLLQAAYDKKIDMTGAAVKTEDRLPHLLFTDYFYSNSDVILVRNDSKDITEKDLINLKTAVIKDYSVEFYLKKKYPNIDIVTVDNITEGLRMLSFGDVEAFVTDFSQAAYYIYKIGYQNLYAIESSKITLDGDLRFGIRNDYPILVEIMNKVLRSMPTDVKLEIYKKWVGLTLKPSLSNTKWYGLLVTVFLLSSIVVAFVFISYLLKKEVNSKTEELQLINQTLEEKVKARTNELEQVIDDLHRTQNQVIQSEKMAFLGKLVAGVAHEINTPLGVILTSSSYLESINEEFFAALEKNSINKESLLKYLEKVDDSAHLIQMNSERVSMLVQAFKELAIEHKNDVPITFNLRAYCDMAISSVKNQYETKHIIFDNDIDDAIIITHYANSILLVLTQLILNAVQHAFENIEDGTVSIGCEFLDFSVIQLYVCDNGSGIKEDIKSQLFDPFFTTSPDIEHMGLGLHIVYNIVNRQLNGSIDILDVPSGGSVFEMKIPLIE
ncbi:MAG: transporter substrate-binding domain-containing protein [Proteocatella sp.]